MAQDPNVATPSAEIVLWGNIVAMQTFNLPHELVCTELDCKCVHRVVGVRNHDPVTGIRDVKAIHRRMCQSVTIMAKGTPGSRSEPMPRSILRVPDVHAAVARGDLRVEDWVSAPVEPTELESESAEPTPEPVAESAEVLADPDAVALAAEADVTSDTSSSPAPDEPADPTAPRISPTRKRSDR